MITSGSSFSNGRVLVSDEPVDDDPDGRRLALAVAAVVFVTLGVLVSLVWPHREEGVPVPPTPSASPLDPGPSPDAQPPPLEAPLGFGQATTGGAGGEEVFVTTDADSGPGSLREAVSGDEPRWILFESDMVIRLAEGLRIGRNKTVDGRGRQVVITGPGTDGLLLVDTSNVILESLVLRDFGDTRLTGANDTPDAIRIESSSDIWVNHLDLSVAGDKLLSVSNGSTGVTVSWNHFHDQDQVLQIGNQFSGQADAEQAVTVHHNYFDATGHRHPVVSYGRAHVFNNYYRDWQLYAVRSQRTAQLFLENNVFAAGDNPRVVLTKPQGDGCNDVGTRCDDSEGFVRAVGNVTTGTARLRDASPERVFDPRSFYDYSADPADAALVQRVELEVGPRG